MDRAKPRSASFTTAVLSSLVLSRIFSGWRGVGGFHEGGWCKGWGKEWYDGEGKVGKRGRGWEGGGGGGGVGCVCPVDSAKLHPAVAHPNISAHLEISVCNLLGMHVRQGVCQRRDHLSGFQLGVVGLWPATNAAAALTAFTEHTAQLQRPAHLYFTYPSNDLLK